MASAPIDPDATVCEKIRSGSLGLIWLRPSTEKPRKYGSASRQLLALCSIAVHQAFHVSLVLVCLVMGLRVSDGFTGDFLDGCDLVAAKLGHSKHRDGSLLVGELAN